MERWREVAGYDGHYEVSDLGNVRSWKAGAKVRVLKPGTNKDGYRLVSLSRGGRAATHYVHHLVAASFLGERPEGLSVCHDDGDTSNNAACNLRYGTHAENMADKRRHGTHQVGEQIVQAKLTTEQVARIRDTYQPGHPEFGGAVLAADFGVSPAQVSYIVNHKSWKEDAAC